jgi:YD repeat-containing protein
VRQQVDGDSAYYAYDENGNRLSLQDTTGTMDWTYDGLDEMTLEEGD